MPGRGGRRRDPRGGKDAGMGAGGDTIPATAALVSGQRLVLELVALVTSASGGNEAQINKVECTA